MGEGGWLGGGGGGVTITSSKPQEFCSLGGSEVIARCSFSLSSTGMEASTVGELLPLQRVMPASSKGGATNTATHNGGQIYKS